MTEPLMTEPRFTRPFFLKTLRPFALAGLVAILGSTLGCGGADETTDAEAPTAAPVESDIGTLPQGLLVSLAVLGETPDGKPQPLPARLGLLTAEDGEWMFREVEDADSNVFHKAMVYAPPSGEPGVLTLGGTEAVVKLWRGDGEPIELWRADFGGRFSRMRDAEIADLDGDGEDEIAVATHDQGVVAILDPVVGEGDALAWSVDEIDRGADTFVHEIEIGDLDGDGTPEVYATPSARNQLDGSDQPGLVTRYVLGEGGDAERQVVVDLAPRHAKEILVADVDGDGTDELYAAVEAVSGGQVEVRRYDLADSGEGEFTESLVATLPDTLTRFLTAGDLDGDGEKEIVAASKKGLWLLRPPEFGDDAPWERTSIDRDSGGFEHASILADLDEDGTDELYVASDQDHTIRRYVWRDGSPVRSVIYRWEEGLSGFTWNLVPVPADLARDLAD